MTSSMQTLAGEPILDGLPLCVPKILMPRDDVNLDKWACVACDQFESEPQYWQGMTEHAGDSPSSLHLVFPEVYLASVTGCSPDEDTKRIAQIGNTMKQYVKEGVFKEREAAFMAIDRKTECVPARKGLVCAIDLEQYNYNCPIPTTIRPTEKTIPARLPPRIAIRKDAPLELPHIFMIIDDPQKTVIEPLFNDPALAVKDYKCSLFKGAGDVTGFTVTAAGTEHVATTMKALAAKEIAAATAAGREPATILIGDGNHSLATAKACWELLKQENPDVDKVRHPARYALVELQNLHDEGVVFEPIHRLLEGANADDVQAYLEEQWQTKAKPNDADVAPMDAVVLVKGGDKSKSVLLFPPADKLPVVSASAAIDDFVGKNPDVKIGFIHGEEPVYAGCASGKSVGILLPGLDKFRFLETIHQIGTLPRKAFSMGEANEKRFYIEARSIDHTVKHS